MDFETLKLTSKSLLLKINIITGWVIPDKELINILVDQFQKLLTEKYRHCNTDEMEYAFRYYGLTIQDWGKQMNLSLVDQVMSQYLEKRFELSKIEEQQKTKQNSIEYKEDISDTAMRDWYNEIFRRVRVDGMAVDFIPVSLYDWMGKNGNITATNAEKKEYLVKAAYHRHQSLVAAYDKNNHVDNETTLKKFNEMKESGVYTGGEINILKSLAKKILLYDLIKNQ